MYTYHGDPRSKERPERQPAPEQITDAHDQAEKDMAGDADLSIHSPNDDLDEGELARLGEDTTDII